MTNQNELRLAHLRLDLSAALRIEDEYRMISPDTKNLFYRDTISYVKPDIGDRTLDLVAWLRVEIAEMEPTNE